MAGDARQRYDAIYRGSLEDPEGFWLDAAAAIDWETPPTVACDASDEPFFRWFPGGRLNTCFNALDRHVLAGRGDQAALIYDSPPAGIVRTYTYAELLDRVAAFAGALRELGVERGDRVVVYMPSIPEAIIAMLACARLGAVHVVVYGGFVPAELAARIDHTQPKVVVSASCGFEPHGAVAYKPLLDEALALADHEVSACVILQREQCVAELGPRDLDWHEAVRGSTPAASVPVTGTDPLFILHTSGTSGTPKGVVRDNGGHAVALHWAMANIYGIVPGSVAWSASDVGWVNGHSFITYGPLIVGATTVLFEGASMTPPDAEVVGRVIAEHKVTTMLSFPTAIRALRKGDPSGRSLTAHDTSSLGALYLGGERLEPATYHWATQVLGIPVIDNWGQTETGLPIVANPRGIGLLPIKPGSPTVAMPGYRVEVLDEGGEPVPAGTEGSIVVRLPLPPGTLTTLWGDDGRYYQEYLAQFPGYYATCDAGYVDDDGYVTILGRTDDVINVSSSRLSTGALEAVISAHPAVAECAVIGVADPIRGQAPKAFVVLQSGFGGDQAGVCEQIIASVPREMQDVAPLESVVVVPALPKTRSGKILRRTMRGIADGRPEPVPSTIADRRVLDLISPLLRSEGLEGPG